MIFMIKISHSSYTALSEPQNLQIMLDPVVGVTALRHHNSIFVLLHISYTSVTSSSVLGLTLLPYLTRDL